MASTCVGPLGRGCLVLGTLLVCAAATAQELIRAMPLSVVASERKTVDDAPPLSLPPLSSPSSSSTTYATAGMRDLHDVEIADAKPQAAEVEPQVEGLEPQTGWVLKPMTPASEFWAWQILPDGLLYRSYLAGGREPRFGSQWFHERDQGWLWDSTLGGRVGILRWGTLDPVWPEGWQIDVEGAAFPRLTLEENRDLVSADFRFGVPLTMRRGRFEAKLAYYHLSSHLGDEYELTHPWLHRINFSREAFVLGLATYPLPSVRTYVEAGWAFYCDGGTKPWEFQCGVDYSPLEPSGLRGDPFFAVNGRIRQEVDFGGNFTLQTGWQWRGATGRLMRLGLHYFNGLSDQYQFFRQHEEQLGIGLWFDY